MHRHLNASEPEGTSSGATPYDTSARLGGVPRMSDSDTTVDPAPTDAEMIESSRLVVAARDVA